MVAGHASKCDPEAPEIGLQREGKAPTPPRPLTQLADEVDGAVVAAVRRVQVHQELGVQPGHFSLQHIGDALALVLLQSALPGTHHRGPGEDTRVTMQMPHASGLLLTARPNLGYIHDRRAVDGHHGWHECAVQGVVEDRGADVGQDRV